jgi:hypothetical protein
VIGMRGERGNGFDRLSPIGIMASPTARPEPVEGPSCFPPFAARTALALVALATLTACARQAASAVQPEAPGFLLGLWHGFIFPVAWLLSLFLRDVAIYAVPNNGGWYDFGYFLGIVVFGVGARKSHVVYRERIIRVRS